MSAGNKITFLNELGEEVVVDAQHPLPTSVSGGGANGLKVDNTDLIAAINSQTGTLVALDPEGIIENAPVGVTGTLVDIKREADTGAVVGYALFGTNTPYTPVGTLEPFVVSYGSVNVVSSALPAGAASEATLNQILGTSIPNWDEVTPTYNATSDVYVYAFDGTTVLTITVNYTDNTKSVISSITKA
jgi:hypothetical protein